MARRVLRVERAGKVLASWVLDDGPIELSLTEDGADAPLCAWRVGASADQRVDEPSLQRLMRGEDDDLTMPLPEPTETTGGLPETEEAPARPRAAKRPVPNLARSPAPVPTGLPSLGLGPAREPRPADRPAALNEPELSLPLPEGSVSLSAPERELTLPPPAAPERELTLPAPEPETDEPSLSMSSLSLPLPLPVSAPSAPRGSANRPAPPRANEGLAPRAIAGGRAAAAPAAPAPAAPAPAAPARPRPAAPASAKSKPRPAAPRDPEPQPRTGAPAPLDPAASTSRPRAAQPAVAARSADEEVSFTAAALDLNGDDLGDVELDDAGALAPAPKPAEVWVRRRSEWRAGGQLSPGQRAVARGGWVRYGEDGVLVVDPGPTLEGSATYLDGTTAELAPGSGPARLSPGASVFLREGDYGLYVRSEAPAVSA